MNTHDVLNRVQKQKEKRERQKKFLKYKKYVCKKFPDATLKITSDKTFYIVDTTGRRVLQDEYNIPDCETPYITWEKTYNLLWSKQIVDRNNRKFNDERVINFSKNDYLRNNR